MPMTPPAFLSLSSHPFRRWVRFSVFSLLIASACFGEEVEEAPSLSSASPEADFFETHVVPVLAKNCYECHSHETKIMAGLALDVRSGLEQGGDSGPAIIPGAPDESLLISAVRYTDKDLQMPPKKRMSDEEIAILEEWVRQGAFRASAAVTDATIAPAAPADDWESLYQKRLGWWSLQPIARPDIPAVTDEAWPRNEVDRFILAGLEAKGLSPTPEAERRTLARRLAFALTGLPPERHLVERFATSSSGGAYDELVDALLDSPHFGERWARHWMDVIHYSDTHGYEWDVPAKNAWMYRDYLVRAFNQDVPLQRLILEQIAGDLIEPRIDVESGINESLLGTSALRLGERRHGDNADAEGVTQEAIANVIDTFSKAFLATTVACAQCHDHKLDAVEQKDYYGLAGVFMSSRWIPRTVDAEDPNLETIEAMRKIKQEVRGELVVEWKNAARTLADRMRPAPPVEAATPEEKGDGKKDSKRPEPEVFPTTLKDLRDRLASALTSGAAMEETWSELQEAFHSERSRRRNENWANLVLLADFTRGEIPHGWRLDGFGLKHGLVRDGDIVIADEGAESVFRLLPGGRWSHVWSERLAGAARSPLFDTVSPPTLSLGYAAGRFAAQSVVVDNAYHSERMKFLKQPNPGWLTFTAGNFPALAGGPDKTPRRVYLEVVTKSLNNYFPPRHAFGGVKPEDEQDPRSWFGLTRVYRHPEGKPPLDELARFAPLFTEAEAPKDLSDAVDRMSVLMNAALERWVEGACDSEDILLLNEALDEGWLPNEFRKGTRLAMRIEDYRRLEAKLQPDRVIGSLDDWNEGRDERIGVRGSYTVLGDSVPRGNIRFLGGPASRAYRESSGRLELALNLASPDNPLTARVFVNRVWHYLFGEGLVRTPDDFGHLGEKPSHPELLDWLAVRFMEQEWSLKEFVRLLVTSATWRQGSIPSEEALLADPENRLWHHHPMRRLDAESIRDAILAVSGRLDPGLEGPPIDPHRAAEDVTKRLVRGPLDGEGRRSLYLKMTLMEPPKFLSLFNQPMPKLTTGRRDSTNVPDQALALMNDPFVVAMADHWSGRVLSDGAANADQRAWRMFAEAFSRPPKLAEKVRLVKLAEECARLHGEKEGDLLVNQTVWRDVAHAIFNLKEFIYVQ